MKFVVLSRREISHFECDVPYIVISITNPGLRTASIAEAEHRLGLLRLQFHDIRRPSGRRVSFTAEMADEILSFAARYSEAEVVVCQCEAGISRSAAVAAALAKIRGESVTAIFEAYHPSRVVYDMILSRHLRRRMNRGQPGADPDAPPEGCL